MSPRRPSDDVPAHSNGDGGDVELPPLPGDGKPLRQPVLDSDAPPPEEATALRALAHYAVLVFSSMVGTLFRLGLDALGTYDGAVVFPLAWVQGVGCGIMGLALARKNEISWLYPPLYTFFTTGIAGSVTTFSSWMLEAYEAFANTEHYNRKGLHSTVNGLAYSFVTVMVSFAGLKLGGYVSSLLPRLPRPPRRAVANGADGRPHGQGTRLLDLLAVASAVASYGGALALYFAAPRRWRPRATYAILLAPPGTMLRFALARINARRPFLDRFPLGTFIANMAGTVIIAGTYAAARRPGARDNPLACTTLDAVHDGFCGCLTTVSTFVVEMGAIRSERWRWAYVFGSVILGQVLVMAVAGGVGWGVGYGPVCRPEA
ncbi:hypothetical protein Q8F55_005606 [Vanrija albida]|uniref:Fluoride ion transporter CrcB n=1 Tax=Vanrija albida TaxID=181172 RepID=A0ABR3Q2B4_9TREE